MSTRDPLDFAWLPEPPADFRTRVRGAEASELRHLATHALSARELGALAKRLRALRASDAGLEPLQPFKLGVVSNATTDLLRDALEASGLRHGLAIEVVATPYDQVAQTALGGGAAALADAGVDAVLLAVDTHGLPLECEIGDADVAGGVVDRAFDFVTGAARGLLAGTGAPCIVQTVPAPVETLFGSADRSIPGTPRWLCDALNTRLAAWTRETEAILLDVAAIAEALGVGAWSDPVHWHLAKLPFSQQYASHYAEHLARIVASLRGRTRRCLVLDLDNTLWAGVIGDDGLGGIVLGQGSAVGEAHLAVQQTALRLRDRGVVLAVCSKNNDDVAREVFREHPDMLLREEHIAVFQANWQDKASNLKAIAEALDLGIDALVLLDDNPAERAQVRAALPEVAVPELPEDAALYARTLLAAGYFELTSFSDEDRKRSDYYQANAQRAAIRERVGDLDAYLESLEMVATLAPFDEVGQERITQLVNKSNQWNLTTRRYTVTEIARMRDDPALFTLQVRLADTFGDNGMISVVICRETPEAGPDAWEIDTWLMSCRVIGRRVEEVVLAELCRAAAAAGRSRLVGRYLPTARNGLVEDHYEKLGFQLEARGDDGSTTWSLAVDAHRAPELPLRVVRRD